MTTSSTSPEIKLAGITIPAIDRCYDDVLPTIPEPFIYTERNMMPRPLQGVSDKVRDTVSQMSEGDTQASTRAVIGFLFGHRLVRECVPDYRLWVNDARELTQRVGGVAKLKSTLDNENTAVLLTLLPRFQHHPEVFDHLLGKLTNDDSRFGVQAMLVCLPDFLQIEATTPESA